jgi:lauroyl/myristoyl acyltransferase
MSFTERRRLVEFILADFIFGRLPRQVSYVVMTAVAWFVATFMRKNLSGLEANLRRVLPGATDAEIHALMQRNARNYAKFWVDLFRIPRMRRDRRDRLVTVDGEEHLHDVLAQGRGCLVVAIHMGGWEGCASYWGAAKAFRTGLITEILEPPQLWRRLLALRTSTGLEIIPLGRTAPRDILRRLKENGVVAGAIDRDLLGSGKAYDFFGAPISVPTGMIEVAQRTGAGILPVVTVRDPGDRYRFISARPIWVGEGDGAVDETVHRLLRIFEGHVRNFPDQWHVMEAIWQTHERRAAARAALPERVTQAAPRREEEVGVG